ncbi:odorant receptor 9a-like isoform X2 [Ceratina calcarata]|uniref:Odorant receptor n=1 Tax=Ceratina calcarata TaxID=156304 RepID=A0AAJ7S5A5_9HYME|nr:odorant receptor 9a-like isoform X2 [Ceratina calcarata]
MRKGFIFEHALGSVRKENMKGSPVTSIDYYLLPNKIFCGAGGMWPIDEKSWTFTKVFAYFRLIYGLVAVSSFVIPEIMLIALNWGDIKILAVGSVLTALGQCLFKMVYLIIRRERTGRLYNEIRSLWHSSDDVEERQSYEKLAYWARICTIVSFTSCMGTASSFVISSAMKSFKGGHSNSSRSRELPYEVWYGVDVSTSPNFEIAFAWQFFAACVTGSVLTGLDTSFMTTILHVAGQFRLISTWLNNIGIEINDGSNDPTKLRADLIKCIRHHQRITNVVDDVNNLLTPIIFVQILTSGIEICLIGLAFVGDGTGNASAIRFMSFIIAVAAQLLMLCWPGEILIEGSQEISHVVYFDVPLYYLPPLYQRELCLVIVRAQRYCSITALTFETLSLHTLTIILKTAVSYFTFLRQIQEN